MLIKGPDSTPGLSRKVLRFWLGLMALVIVGSLIPSMGLNNSGFGLDTPLHFILYGVLACLPLILVRDRKRAFLLGISMAPLGYLLELGQTLIVGREFSALDLLANNAGVLFGLVVGTILRFKNKYERQKNADLSIRESLSE